jgi:hypothetical protein
MSFFYISIFKIKYLIADKKKSSAFNLIFNLLLLID